MLKITVYDRPTSWQLQLEGKLAGAWITAVENTLRSAPQRDSGKHLEIELTDVTSVGEVGKHLLTLMHRVGAHFIAAGVVMKALIQEITGETTGTLSRGQRSWKRVRNLVCLLALLIIVHDVSLLAEDVPAAPIRLTLKDAVTLGAETKSLYDAGYGRNPPGKWSPDVGSGQPGLAGLANKQRWRIVVVDFQITPKPVERSKKTVRCLLPLPMTRLLTVKIHVEAI